MAAKGEAASSSHRSLWKANAAAFAFLVLFSAATTLWQIRHMDQLFIKDAEEHARLAANIIKINAKGSLLAGQALEEIISVFLKNSITFIDFLQSVEPFTQAELKAFAQKSGLAGITILEGKERIQSQPGWLPLPPKNACPRGREGSERLLAYPEQGLYLVARRGRTRESCIIAGIRNERIASLYETIDIRRSLQEISSLEGIKYVELSSRKGRPQDREPERPVLKSGPAGYVVEVVIPLSSDSLLIMGIDADPLKQRHRLRWMFFTIFTSVLVLIGAISSLLLYRHQKRYIERMKHVEAQLHRRREEANLGRYAAAIAHEIRNPLNAVSMGIQKITMKKEGIPEEDRRLMTILLDELNRVARIISDLLNYARPVEPEPERIDVSSIVDRAVILARQRYPSKDIRVSLAVDGHPYAWADPDLLHQLVSNLVLNAFEAYDSQGEVKITIKNRKGRLELQVANQGRIPEPEQLSQIFEPYFTRKVRGTGLGLAVARRIVQAHGGAVHAELDKGGWLVIRIEIPAAEEQKGGC